MRAPFIVLAGILLSLGALGPRALHAQAALCAAGTDLEVQVDGRWWPARVADGPRDGQCAVVHRAYGGIENTHWVDFARLRPAGTDPSSTGPRPTSPLCIRGRAVEITLQGRPYPAVVVGPHHSDGSCLVEHHAYAGIGSQQFLESAAIAEPGAAPRAPAAPPTAATPVPTVATAPAAPPAPPRRPPVAAAQAAPALPAATPVGPSRELARGTYLLVDGYGNHRHRTFLPGGFVYSGVPGGGPEVFGLAQARRGDPRELGTYTLRGGALVVAWGGGQAPETSTFAIKGADVVLDGYPYQALRKYPRGHRLEGRYTTRAYNSMGIAGGGTMTWGGSSTVVFRPDGTFDYGDAGMAASSAGAGTAASGSSTGSGRYAITGNTVTFTFGDGTVQHALIHPWSGEEAARTPGSVNLNGRTYTRK